MPRLRNEEDNNELYAYQHTKYEKKKKECNKNKITIIKKETLDVEQR